MEKKVKQKKVRDRIHPNGGGIITDNAKAGKEVIVEKGARIEGNAKVAGNVLVKSGALIGGEAVIEGKGKQIIIGGDAIIGGNWRIFKTTLRGIHL
jgi:UDP-3-O-[3-hydroxymyristoyl] glucosamine N-acyltransferase